MENYELELSAEKAEAALNEGDGASGRDEEEVSRLQEQLNERQAELEQLHASVQRSDAALQEAKERAAKTEDELRAASEKLSKATAGGRELEQELERQLEAADGKYHELEAAKKGADDEAVARTAEVADLSAKVAELTKAVEGLDEVYPIATATTTTTTIPGNSAAASITTLPRPYRLHLPHRPPILRPQT